MTAVKFLERELAAAKKRIDITYRHYFNLSENPNAPTAAIDLAFDRHQAVCVHEEAIVRLLRKARRAR